MKRNSAYAELRQLILNEYLPGQPLSEQEMATRLGISRTPVREALGRLEKDGLVAIVPHRGTFVATLTARDVQELFEVREALELYAVKRAVGLVDEAALERIGRAADGIVQEFTSSLDAEAQYRALAAVFAELHHVILTSRGNTRFITFLDSIGGTWQLARRMLMRRISAEDVTASYVEHGEIIAALRSHDPAAAERAMQKHLENSRARMLIAVGR